MAAPVPTPDVFADALTRDEAYRLDHDGVPYVRVARDRPDAERGAVLAGGHVVATYPHIGRIAHLEHGLAEQAWPLAPSWHAEEKIDGYNVRVVAVDGRALAFTRGGFACPFTTDRLPDLADVGDFFADHPDLVLCAEVAGPENPYIPTAVPRAPEGVGLFVFDVMRLDEGGFLPLAARDALVARYGLPAAPHLGTFGPSDLPAIRRVVLALDREGAEGIVLKPPTGEVRLKYVTPSSAVHDIEVLASRLAGLPPEFFVARVVRLGVGLRELGLLARGPEVEERLGAAFVQGMQDALRQMEEERAVQQTCTVRLRSEAAADRLLEHLNLASEKIQVRLVERSVQDGYVVLVIRKVFQRSTGTLTTLLGGGKVYD